LFNAAVAEAVSVGRDDTSARERAVHAGGDGAPDTSTLLTVASRERSMRERDQLAEVSPGPLKHRGSAVLPVLPDSHR
jgi:hypothetical protein